MAGTAGMARIAGMAKANALPGVGPAKVLLRSASWAFRVIGCPSRLMPRFTTRPGGISWIMRRSCCLASIDGENNVVLFQPGRACGGVLIDQRDLHAVFFLEFEVAEAIGGDVASINSEVRSAAEVLAGETKGLAKGLLRTKLSSVSHRQKYWHNQHSKDRVAHVRPLS